MFIHFNNIIRRTDTINCIECDKYLKDGEIRVYFSNGTSEWVTGAEATNLIMCLCPALLEGKRAKYVRHAWAIHNLIGHPLMQLFSWLGYPALGIKIHDATIPAPKKTAQLPKAEVKDIFKLPPKERSKYIVSARVDIKENLLLFIRGNGAGAYVDLSFFTPTPKETPDFDHIEIIDHGQTVKFGNYEAATDAILEEAEKIFTSPKKISID